MLALFVGVKTSVVLPIRPNIVMDGLQAARGGEIVATIRRFALFVGCGAVGTIVGTGLLATLSGRVATLIRRSSCYFYALWLVKQGSSALWR